MLKRLAILLLVSSSATSAFATNTPIAAESASLSQYHSFQEFDNQYYVGYGTGYGNLTNSYGQNSNYGSTFIGIGVEHLFDMGLWARVDGTLLSGYSNFNSSNPNAETGPLGQDPSVGNLDLKVGYAFNAIPDKFLVTPYILLGRNTNLTSNSLNNNMSSSNNVNNLSANVTQDYFLTGGFGGRVEYRIDKYIELYADQNALYNSDNSQPNSSYTPASNYQLTSTLGAKFNVWDELQLGVNGFYTYTQLSGAPSIAQQYQLYQQNQIGMMATVGLTY